MKYFKVIQPSQYTVRGELFTKKEFDKLKDNSKFEEVEISKNKTYFFFGARFQVNNGYLINNPI